ncbi:MAG TPA: PA2779 family protein [Armatimonadota bacterium]|nr:PA2779 family protein [Armatimonadota bacterium]
MRKLERRCAWLAVVTVAVMLFTMAAACAAPIQSKMTTEPKGERAQVAARAEAALDAAGVTAKLKGFGLTEQQVQQRLSQLSADELQQIATGAEALAVGGAQEPTLSTTTWLLIIVIVLLLGH